MDKYWLLAGDQYYPMAGLADFRGAYDSYIAASDALVASPNNYDWAYIVHVRNNEPWMTQRVK